MILYTNTNAPAGGFGFCPLLEQTAGLDDWEASLDKLISEEQTGSYHGKCKVQSFWLEVMRKLAKRGVRRPYYEAISPSACLYRFEISGNSTKHTVTHSATEQEWTAGLPMTIEPWPKTLERGCFTVPNLLKWSYWDAKAAFSARYSYMFVPTSIGGIFRATDNVTGDVREICRCDF